MVILGPLSICHFFYYSSNLFLTTRQIHLKPPFSPEPMTAPYTCCYGSYPQSQLAGLGEGWTRSLTVVFKNTFSSSAHAWPSLILFMHMHSSMTIWWTPIKCPYTVYSLFLVAKIFSGGQTGCVYSKEDKAPLSGGKQPRPFLFANVRLADLG